MKKSLVFIFFLISFLSFPSLNYSEEATPKHGGIIKKTTYTFLEVTKEKEEGQGEGKTNIYITGHDFKNIPKEKLSLSAMAIFKGKEYPLELSLVNDHYSFGPANSYLHKENNFVLLLTISFSGKSEKTFFQINNNAP